MCMAIRKLLLPYGRKQVQLQNVCKNKKKCVKILLLEFLNVDHILHFFLPGKDFFDKLYVYLHCFHICSVFIYICKRIALYLSAYGMA